jgi:hypothetical protein
MLPASLVAVILPALAALGVVRASDDVHLVSSRLTRLGKRSHSTYNLTLLHVNDIQCV